jgi:hypothetical protein
MLQRDFASQLYNFIRFVIPPSDVRGKLWRRLIPSRAPLATDINFVELGRKFELNAGSIANAIARATAEAAMRLSTVVSSSSVVVSSSSSDNEPKVSQKDLVAAGEAETAKLRHGNFDLVSKLFT